MSTYQVKFAETAEIITTFANVQTELLSIGKSITAEREKLVKMNGYGIDTIRNSLSSNLKAINKAYENVGSVAETLEKIAEFTAYYESNANNTLGGNAVISETNTFQDQVFASLACGTYDSNVWSILQSVANNSVLQSAVTNGLDLVAKFFSDENPLSEFEGIEIVTKSMSYVVNFVNGCSDGNLDFTDDAKNFKGSLSILKALLSLYKNDAGSIGVISSNVCSVIPFISSAVTGGITAYEGYNEYSADGIITLEETTSLVYEVAFDSVADLGLSLLRYIPGVGPFVSPIAKVVYKYYDSEYDFGKKLAESAPSVGLAEKIDYDMNVRELCEYLKTGEGEVQIYSERLAKELEYKSRNDVCDETTSGLLWQSVFDNN